MRIQDALQILLDAGEPPGVVRVPVAAAVGRVAVSDVVARVDAPAQPRAVTGGYLVRPGDCTAAQPEAPARLDIAPVLVRSGERPRLRRGQAWPVQTGSPLPEEDLAVLPAHAVERAGSQLLVRRPPPPGLNILPVGGTIARNEMILAAGEVITPPAVGAMTAAGIHELDVFRRPRVLLMGVGFAESVESGSGSIPGAGNLSMLGAAVSQAGCEVVQVGIVDPDPDTLASVFRRSLDDGVDVVLTAGGAAPHGEGPVAAAWRRVGGHILIGSLESRPGRSFLAGSHTDTWLIALSPAPASSLALFTVVVRPFLLRLAGRERVAPPVVRARLSKGCPRDPSFPRLAWARLEGRGPFTAEPAIDPARGRMYYPMNANGLVVLPPGPSPLSSCQFVWAIPLGTPDLPGSGERFPFLQPPGPLVFGVAGPPGTDRAAVVDRLARALASEGLQVARVRRAPEGLAWPPAAFRPSGDREGSEEDRGTSDPAGPGAGCVLVAPDANLFYEASDLPGGPDEDRLGRLLDRMTLTRQVPDVVLVEGFSDSDLPKVWVGPAGRDAEPAGVVAAVRTGAGALEVPGVPVVAEEDVRPLVEAVLGWQGAGEDGDDDDVF